MNVVGDCDAADPDPTLDTGRALVSLLLGVSACLQRLV